MMLLERLSQGRAVVFSGLVYVLSQTLLVFLLKPLGLDTFLRLQVSFSRDFYLETFARWEAGGIFNLYAFHLYPDFLHIVWYALFLFSFTAFLLREDQEAQRSLWILGFPVLAGLGDFLENLFQVVFLAVPENRGITTPLVVASSLASTVKWAFAGFSILNLVWLLSRRLVKPAG